MQSAPDAAAGPSSAIDDDYESSVRAYLRSLPEADRIAILAASAPSSREPRRGGTTTAAATPAENAIPDRRTSSSPPPSPPPPPPPPSTTATTPKTPSTPGAFAVRPGKDPSLRTAVRSSAFQRLSGGGGGYEPPSVRSSLFQRLSNPGRYDPESLRGVAEDDDEQRGFDENLVGDGGEEGDDGGDDAASDKEVWLLADERERTEEDEEEGGWGLRPFPPFGSVPFSSLLAPRENPSFRRRLNEGKEAVATLDWVKYIVPFGPKDKGGTPENECAPSAP